MYKVSVMYPNQKDCHFDLEYYRTKHMALVEKHMKPFGSCGQKFFEVSPVVVGSRRRTSASATSISTRPTAMRRAAQPLVVFCAQIFPISPIWHPSARLAKF